MAGPGDKKKVIVKKDNPSKTEKYSMYYEDEPLIPKINTQHKQVEPEPVVKNLNNLPYMSSNDLQLEEYDYQTPNIDYIGQVQKYTNGTDKAYGYVNYGKGQGRKELNKEEFSKIPVKAYAMGGLVGDLASFGQPAQQQIMPFPFQELASLGQQVQKRADVTTGLLSGFGQQLLNQKVGPKDQMKLNQMYADFNEGVAKIYDENGGVMSDVNARNKARNLINKFISNPDLDRYSRNYANMSATLKKRMENKDYRRWNDPSADVVDAYFSGQVGTDDIGLYTPSNYLGNKDVDTKLDDYIDDLKASGSYQEYANEEGYIVGQGYEGIGRKAVENVLYNPSTIRDFFTSQEGQEFIREKEYLAGRSLSPEEKLSAFQMVMEPRIQEKVFAKTRNTLKGDPNFGGGINAGGMVSQNVDFANPIPTLLASNQANLSGAGFKIEDDKFVWNEDLRNKLGYTSGFFNMSFAQLPGETEESPKTSSLPEQARELINIVYARSGQKPTGDGRLDATFAEDYINNFYKQKASSVVNRPYKPSNAAQIEGTLNDLRETLRYRDPQTGKILDYSAASEDIDNAQIRFVGSFRPENQHGPGANLVYLENSKGEKKQYIADAISSQSAKEHSAWALSQAQHYVDGFTTFALNPADEKQVQDEGLNFHSKMKYLKKHNKPFMVTRLKEVNNELTPMVEFHEDGNVKTIPMRDAFKLIENGR